MEIINSIPGRVRLKETSLYFDKGLTKCINAYIDNLYGVKFCRANYTTATLLIVYDTQKTNLDTISDNISKALKSMREKDNKSLSQYNEYYKILEKRDKSRRRFLLYGLIYIAFKIKQSLYGKFSISRNVKVLEVASLVTIIGGYPLLKRVYKKFTKNVPADSDLILKLSAISFTLIRESAKGVLVIVLKHLNDYIKYYSDAESLRLLTQTMSRTSGMAWIKDKNNQDILIPSSALKIGDEIYIHKGETSPVDGIVIEGSCIINSLYYSGQPIVLEIEKNNKIFEGMTVVSGEVKIKVLSKPKQFNDYKSLPKLKINESVIKYQETITKISLLLAAFSYAVTQSFLRSISILLVLTPSGSITALSTGIKSYLYLLYKNKIYLKNPDCFEKVLNTNKIVFDKTGTLTYGYMSVENVYIVDKRYSARDVLETASLCEVNNYHPIAVTLRNYTGDLDTSSIESTIYLPSKGVKARVDNHNILIGKIELMEENNIDVSDVKDIYDSYQRELKIPVLLSIDNKIAGIIVMQDKLRKNSYELLYKLRYYGIDDISMITGDSYEKALDICKRLKINEFYSECTAHDKVEIIKKYKERNTVMMIGDGINDIEAMYNADVSVSFADTSCDKVKLGSDCIIFEDNIDRISDLIVISQKSYGGIKQSIVFSKLYNLTFGVLACLGYFDAFTAKTLNTINSLIVLVLNKRIENIRREKIYIPKENIK